MLTDGEKCQDDPGHARSLVSKAGEIKCKNRYRYIEHNLCNAELGMTAKHVDSRYVTVGLWILLRKAIYDK